MSIATITLAVCMTSLDNSMINVALPAMSRELGVSPATSIWLISSYQLALAVSLLPFSSLGEIYGYRKVYLCGLVLFFVSSAAVSMSDSFLTIIMCRVVQGLGGAGILSVNIALIRFVYPRRDLGKGIGINSFVAASALTAGAPIGSLIIAYADWHGMFAVNVPVGLVAVVLALFAIPPTPLSAHRFDLPGAILCSTAFGLLLFFINGLGHGHPWWVVMLEGAAVVLLSWAYLNRERGKPAPLFPIDLFRIPLFRISVLTSVCTFTAQMQAMLVLPFLIEHLGYHDPAVIGFLIAPWPAAVIVTALVTGRLIGRLSAGILGTAGILIFVAGLVLLATLDVRATPIRIIIGMALCGAGFGLFQSPNNWALISSAPAPRSGAASGILGSARLLGQSIGAASVAVFLTNFGLESGPTISLFAGTCIAVLAACVSALRTVPRRKEAVQPRPDDGLDGGKVITKEQEPVSTDVIFKVEAPAFREALREKFNIHDLMKGRPLPKANVQSTVRVLVTSGLTGASAEEIQSMPELSLICCIGTGYENVDLLAARKRGIVITHGAGSNAPAVADHAVAMLLAIMRNITVFDSMAKQDLWRGGLQPRPIPTGKKLGIIGLGAIGRRIARRLEGFDMEVSYHTRTVKADVSWKHYASVIDLASEVDCLIVAAPGGAGTYHMIDEQVLAALGPKGFLVNVGRGSLVDTDALAEALRSNTIAGAALDVFEEEPSIPLSLRSLTNVILTPHIGAYAPEVQAIGANLLLRNIEHFLHGKGVLSPIPEMEDAAT
ncbi:MAG TPA: MFS transporter [Bradyrhizobium sp.]|nr:MFS transporter [Bradyrhizobium sp.]